MKTHNSNIKAKLWESLHEDNFDAMLSRYHQEMRTLSQMAEGTTEYSVQKEKCIAMKEANEEFFMALHSK